MELKVHSLAQFDPLISGLTVFGIVTGTAKSFDWLDGMLSDKGRKSIAQWLMNEPGDASHDSWAAVFPYLIDRVFGPRVLSIRFFFRSCVASVIAILVVSAMMYGVVWRVRDWNFLWYTEIKLLICSIGSNMLPDYWSLVLSRAIVRMMEKRPKPGAIAALLVLDTALTVCIGLASANLGLYILVRGGIPLKKLLGNLLEVSFLREATLHEAGLAGTLIIFMRILFYSSFFTSVWVWLYVASGVLVKTLQRGRLVWRNISPYLDIENRPLRAMGRVAGLLAGAAYGLILAWARLFEH